MKGERKMTVYAVLEICDYEYFCRKVRKIYSTREAAEKYILALGNRKHKSWTGMEMDEYTIEEYEVEE